ncbi:MAG: T9SS type A sorting domain-containing protein [Flavobacteriales bacterium]|nr:T9SS type A sorting domain-containing protein [Flavobacteriales bacterium]
MKSILSILFLSITVVSLSQNNVCFTIEANPNSNDAALTGFTKYIKVLDCFEIYAESGLTDAQVLHAAAIAAELLDNDEDGIIDDATIYAQLSSNQAMMPLFSVDGSSAENTFNTNYSGSGVSAVLYSAEVDPGNPGFWGMDATVEEIMHTINSVGHVNAYPSAFSLSPNSSLMTTAMDTARGGQYVTIPNPYPAAAWYHYNDQTCDYECMAIEYIYWSTVSNMGLLDDTGICSGIANEWEPCTQPLFQSTDVLMYNLITNAQYKIPQNAPDGNYCIITGVSDESNFTKTINIFPNPSVDYLMVDRKDNQSVVKVFNFLGELLIETTENSISTQHLPSGIYILQTENETVRFEVTH